MGIYLLKLRNEIFDLHSLGNTGAVCTAGSTGISELAGTLDKMQVIVVSPVLDICLTDQIHGADQLHPLEVCAVEFRHHSLYLCSIKHSHKDRLDHIIIMMAKRNLVTSHTFGIRVQMSTPHTRTQITWWFFHMVYRFKNIRFKNLDRDLQSFGIFLDHLTIRRAVTRIHHEKFNLKIKLIVTF